MGGELVSGVTVVVVVAAGVVMLKVGWRVRRLSRRRRTDRRTSRPRGDLSWCNKEENMSSRMATAAGCEEREQRNSTPPHTSSHDV